MGLSRGREKRRKKLVISSHYDASRERLAVLSAKSICKPSAAQDFPTAPTHSTQRPCHHRRQCGIDHNDDATFRALRHSLEASQGDSGYKHNCHASIDLIKEAPGYPNESEPRVLRRVGPCAAAAGGM